MKHTSSESEVALLGPLVGAVAARAAEMVLEQIDLEQIGGSPWLDVKGAASYLPAYTPAAIRGLVQRREIPFTKTPNGRILFDRRELDAWVRGEAGSRAA